MWLDIRWHVRLELELDSVMVNRNQICGTSLTKSTTHGQRFARPTITFPASEHHRLVTGTKLYCLVTETHR